VAARSCERSPALITGRGSGAATLARGTGTPGGSNAVDPAAAGSDDGSVKSTRWNIDCPASIVNGIDLTVVPD
jgi:hypothetical protein